MCLQLSHIFVYLIIYLFVWYSVQNALLWFLKFSVKVISFLQLICVCVYRGGGGGVTRSQCSTVKNPCNCLAGTKDFPENKHRTILQALAKKQKKTKKQTTMTKHAIGLKVVLNECLVWAEKERKKKKSPFLSWSSYAIILSGWLGLKHRTIMRAIIR